MAGSRKKRNQELLPQHDPRAPLDSPGFLSAAQPVLSLLTADLLERADASTAVTAELRRTHAAEHAAGRTAEPYEVWRRQRMVQVAAAWLLSCVFVRVLEDRGLLARHRLAGPGAEDSQRQFGELAPYLGPRDYLLTLFRELAKLPATAPLFDARHNLVWRLAPSQGGAQALLDLLRAPQPDAPAFRFGQPDTRFLGDLYQDISADVRETYALLQTPDFVESFILDRTLDPALAEYGPGDTTLIDPTCGSGHFLLGAFARLLDAQRHQNPGHSAEAHANNALARVFGVDINPYAVAIARFRLTLAFWDAIGLRRLAGVQSARPPLNVVVGDSLFHAAGEQTDFADMPGQASTTWYGPTFAFDDEEAAKTILGRRFAAVVGNPPYITVKDAALRETYRKRFPNSASGKYALSAPFLEQFFLLARQGGFTGQITSNAFIKREFGKKLVETVFPRLDLTLLVNTAGAYIPGHGTPTVLIFGRNRRPEGEDAAKVLAVLSKRGEPGIPANPATGEVWTSIVQHWHDVGFDGEYISVERVNRVTLDRHPWSLEGGGAGQLKEWIESRGEKKLADVATSIGFMAITGLDDAFIAPAGSWRRRGAEDGWIYACGTGESARDWKVDTDLEILFPYKDERLSEPSNYPAIAKSLWPLRRTLLDRPDFGGKKYIDVGRPWHSFHQVPLDRLKTRLGIAFGEVATHNHFAFDRGGKVFDRTAPLIKLAVSANEDEHLALLAYLNSSLACFWMKQVSMNKGGSGIGRGIQDESWEGRYQFSATKLEALPLPYGVMSLATLGRKLDALVSNGFQKPCMQLIDAVLTGILSTSDLNNQLKALENSARAVHEEAVCIQERLDWEVYALFRLLDGEEQCRYLDILRLLSGGKMRPGSRPFEHILHVENPTTAWFNRNSYALPSPPTQHEEAGIQAIQASPTLRLLETATNKRRWAPIDFDRRVHCIVLQRVADQAELSLSESTIPKRLADWLSVPMRERMYHLFADPSLGSDPEPHSRLDRLVREDSIPFLAVLRHTDSGIEKRNLWEMTWALQRREDGREKVEYVPVPPEYEAKDFRDPNFFRLRGKLDVAHERFISYPGCESDADGEPVYGWAGWSHLQRANALMDLFYKRKNDEGWMAERLTPILAGLLELLPWLKQWHNEPDADGSRMGDDYEAVLDEELRGLGLSRDKLNAWRPASGRGRGGAAKAAAKASTSADTDDAPTVEAVDKAPTAEATAKRRGRPPRTAAPAPAVPAPAAPPVPAPPASAGLSLFPGEPPAQARKRGRPKKT